MPKTDPNHLGQRFSGSLSPERTKFLVCGWRFRIYGSGNRHYGKNQNAQNRPKSPWTKVFRVPESRNDKIFGLQLTVQDLWFRQPSLGQKPKCPKQTQNPWTKVFGVAESQNHNKVYVCSNLMAVCSWAAVRLLAQPEGCVWAGGPHRRAKKQF